MKITNKSKRTVTVELSNTEYRSLCSILLTVVTGVNQWNQLDWDEFETEAGLAEKDVRKLKEDFFNGFPLKDE